MGSSRFWFVAGFYLLLLFAGGAWFLFRPPTLTIPESTDAKLKILLQKSSVEVIRQVTAADLVVVNFWASWCGPCFAETPSLIRFAQKYRDRLVLISISQDTVTKEYQGFRQTFPGLETAAVWLYRDADQSLARQFGVDKLPDTYVYSRQKGRYFRLSGGYDWDQPDTLAQLEHELGSK